MSKPRKYQITPNSINPNEEAAVRSVMDKFRQRAEQPEPVDPETLPEPVRDVVHFPADSQNIKHLDSQSRSSLDSQIGKVSASQSPIADISNINAFGKPDNNESDSQIDIFVYPNNEIDASQESSNDIAKIETLDSRSAISGSPKEQGSDSQDQDSGQPEAKTLAIKLAPASEAPNTGAKNLARNKTLASQTSLKTQDWAKYDKARSTESIFIRADAELISLVKHFNIENKINMREFFELAATAFMDEAGKPKKGNLASNIASDERRLMIRFKTKDPIINLYHAYNRVFSPNALWRPADDRLGEVYNEVPIQVVEMGIMDCQMNKLENDPDCQISSFKYYSKQINKYLGYAEAGAKMLDMMVEIGRKRWREGTGREVELSFLNDE